jgi:uncharacterized membrane protein YkvA (DUF1232 family)
MSKTKRSRPSLGVSRRAGMFTLLRRPRAMWRFLMDPHAPRFPQLLAILTIVYLVSPLDLIPDVVPILGWLDDIGLTSFAIAYVAASAARYENRKAEAQAQTELPVATAA